MNISCQDSQINIRTRDAKVVVGGEIKINDFSIAGPGEYEIANCAVVGLAQNPAQPIYLMDIEGTSIVYFVQVDGELDNKILERIEEPDILILPTAKTQDSDVKKLTELINQVDPKVVISANPEINGSFSRVEGLNPEVCESIKLTKGTLPLEGRKIVVLQCRSK